MTVLNGELIRNLRDAEGIKQKDLAQRAQISLRSLQKAEAGDSVGSDTHNAIATALRVRPVSALADLKLTIEQLRRLRTGGYVVADQDGTVSLKTIPPMPAASPAMYAQLLADDENLERQYATFHTQMYRQYRAFQRNTRGPEDLLELLHQAGMPPNVAQGDGRADRLASRTCVSADHCTKIPLEVCHRCLSSAQNLPRRPGLGLQLDQARC